MLTVKERKVFIETKIRNLKRKQARLAQHSSLTDEYFETGKEIESCERELKMLQ